MEVFDLNKQTQSWEPANAAQFHLVAEGIDPWPNGTQKKTNSIQSLIDLLERMKETGLDYDIEISFGTAGNLNPHTFLSCTVYNWEKYKGGIDAYNSQKTN